MQEILKKLDECMQIINTAKKRQEAEANKNASILLEELDYEKKKEERRKVAAQKKRDRKKQKKKKKSTDEKDCNGHFDQYDEDEQDDEEVALDRVSFSFAKGDERTSIIMNGE